MLSRQAAGLPCHIGHDVRRVVSHNQNAVEAVFLQILADTLGDLRVDPDQFQTGLSRFLGCPGGQNDDVGIPGIFIGARPDFHFGRGVHQTVVEVHGLAPGFVLVHIHQDHFIDSGAVEHCIGKAHAYHAGADQHDSALGNFFHKTEFLLILIIERLK